MQGPHFESPHSSNPPHFHKDDGQISSNYSVVAEEYTYKCPNQILRRVSGSQVVEEPTGQPVKPLSQSTIRILLEIN
jgi:hypothetical protein